MIKRKLVEFGSILYRKMVYPFIRIIIELKTNSIMKPGSYLNKGTKLMGNNFIGRDVKLAHCIVGFGSIVQNESNLSNTRIGKYCAVGGRTDSEIGRHPTHTIAAIHPAFYSTHGAMGYSYAKRNLYVETKYIDKDQGIQIEIGNDVWLGNDTKILEGVTIADGCIIATGAIVTRDTEPYGIYAGVPAKLIKKRFSDEEIDKLMKLRWWDKDEKWIKEHIDDFSDVKKLICNL